MRGVPWSPEAPLALGYVPQGDTRGQRLERKGEVSRRATDPRSLRAAPRPRPREQQEKEAPARGPPAPSGRAGRRLRLGLRAFRTRHVLSERSRGARWAPVSP